MAEQHSIETFPARGTQVVRWDPADPESVERARAEFERLRAEGYALFALEEKGRSSIERRTGDFEPEQGSFVARSTVPTQTTAFNPDATRIVAVRPVRGG